MIVEEQGSHSDSFHVRWRRDWACWSVEKPSFGLDAEFDRALVDSRGKSIHALFWTVRNEACPRHQLEEQETSKR